MNALEKMVDLKSRAKTTLDAMITYSREMLVLSIEHISEKLKETWPDTQPVTRALLATLDAHDSPASNDRMLQAFRERWPEMKPSEIVFDKQNNKFLIFAL